MEIPKYIVFRVDVMRKGTSVELTNITDEVEDVIFKADRKTEPTISKMEQVETDINVRSKTEPLVPPKTSYNSEPQTERSE